MSSRQTYPETLSLPVRLVGDESQDELVKKLTADFNYVLSKMNELNQRSTDIEAPESTVGEHTHAVNDIVANTKIFNQNGTTRVDTEETLFEDIIRLYVDSTQEAQLDLNGLTLKTGASVNELSTDGTLAGNSDDAVPTEKATKLYVDTHEADTTDIHGIVDTSKLNTSDAAITDHAIVRGDGGAQKVQDSGVIIDDSDNVIINGVDVLQFSYFTGGF